MARDQFGVDRAEDGDLGQQRDLDQRSFPVFEQPSQLLAVDQVPATPEVERAARHRVRGGGKRRVEPVHRDQLRLPREPLKSWTLTQAVVSRLVSAAGGGGAG